VKGDSQEDDENESRHKNMGDLHRSDVAVLVLKPRSNKDTTGLLAKDHNTMGSTYMMFPMVGACPIALCQAGSS
jgi:hypothetical protein